MRTLGAHQVSPHELARQLRLENHEADRVKNADQVKNADEVNADVQIMVGMYSAVLLAAFGEVSIKLGDQDHHTAKVHPFFLFLACTLLFVIQSSAIVALTLNMNWTVQVGRTGHINVLQPTQLMMILIVQLMNFKLVINSARLMVFVLNPITWLEMRHPKRQQWVPVMYQETPCAMLVANLVRPICLAPFAIAALMMKFSVGYLVCTESVSVILSTGNVQDAMFNALAITFLAELNGPFWQFLYMIFRLETKHEDESWATFRLVFDSGVWEEGSHTLSEYGREKAVMANFVQKVVLHFPFLTRAGGADIMEDFIPFVVVFFVYARRIFMIAHAFDTAVLPAVRDVCTIWRWQHHEATPELMFAARMFVLFEDHISPIAIRNKTDLLHRKMSVNSTEPCERGGKYYRLGAHAAHHLLRKYPLHILASLTLVVFLLLGHRIFSCIFAKFHSKENDREVQGEDEEDDDEDESEDESETTEEASEADVKR